MFQTILVPFFLFPLVIVLARITDVSLGTLRIVLVSKGFKKIAPIISFFESFIWILVAARILSNLSTSEESISLLGVIQCVAYALGYALGTYFGMKIEARLSLGQVLVRAIVPREAENLVKTLRENKFGLTAIDASGKDGSVKVLFIVINRKELSNVLNVIKSINPATFYTIENVQTVNKGYFPELSHHDPVTKFTRAFIPGGRK